MSTLAKLGFHDWSGDTNVYDWLLLNFNSNNCGPEVVTYGLVTDLKDLLHLKRSKHEEVPRNKLSRQQLCHLLIYLVTRISSENVTKNFENGLFKRLTAKDKENHDPNEVWESGIQYIKKQSLGVIGAPQGEGCHKTNMVQKMAVRFRNFAIRSLVVELLARARKGRACVHARNGANSLGGMSQDLSLIHI